MHGEKDRWKLHNTMCYFEQMLEAALQKTAAWWPLISHNIQTRWTRYAGQVRTHS